MGQTRKISYLSFMPFSENSDISYRPCYNKEGREFFEASPFKMNVGTLK